jgi:hypothetical protein
MKDSSISNSIHLKLFILPKLEVRVDHPVGEALTANTDTLKYTVTSQLVHDKMRVNNTGLLHLVGDDATDEVRLCALQGGHQVVKLFLWDGEILVRITASLIFKISVRRRFRSTVSF